MALARNEQLKRIEELELFPPPLYVNSKRVGESKSGDDHPQLSQLSGVKNEAGVEVFIRGPHLQSPYSPESAGRIGVLDDGVSSLSFCNCF